MTGTHFDGVGEPRSCQTSRSRRHNDTPRSQHFQLGAHARDSTAQATERDGSCRRLDCMAMTPDSSPDDDFQTTTQK